MLSIEPLSPADLPATAALHRKYLHLGLFPRLGRHFLGLYQESFARSPFGIALVARSDEDVVGALFGTTSKVDHYHWVMRHFGPQLALAGSGALITRPQVALDFARTRLGRYARGLARHVGVLPTPAPGSTSGRKPLSVLSHIVTDLKARRQGVGRGLVEEFKSRASARGVHRALLVTEEGGLGTPFFEKLGCNLIAQRKGQDGAMLREYRLILDEEGAYEDLVSDRSTFSLQRAYPQRLRPIHSLPVQRH